MITLVSFLVAIAILVAVHEWGHYRMALACGVKVLEFSVGFGPRLWRWVSPRTGTQYAVAMVPLGGFVRMLDEREAPVPDADLHRAFNRKPLRARVAIVAAGPLANLVLAVLLLSVVHWTGTQETRARIAAPVPGSLFAAAGFTGGETIEAVGTGQDEPVAVQSLEEFAGWLMQAAVASQDLTVRYHVSPDRADGQAGPSRTTVLRLSGWNAQTGGEHLLGSMGFVGPWMQPVLGKLMQDSAALAAGLAPGDRVLSVDSRPVLDASQLREWIRQSGATQVPGSQDWTVERNGTVMHVQVTPRQEPEGAQTIGRIGAVIGTPPETVDVRYGVVDGLSKATQKTWDGAVLTLCMIGKMLTGQASLKNLSGPVTIADYAGRSASVGLASYLAFLAVVSISLGVLNLLPLPVLDGGHLMYYLWEGVTGKSVSEAWMSRLQRIGLVAIFLMMSVAVFNDLQRLLS